MNDLIRDWEIAGAEWRDHARKAFEEDFIEEVLSGGRAAVRSMVEITQLLRRVVRECS
jgi:hypothetical protein